MNTYTFPFISPFPGEIARPYVPVKISNPATLKSVDIYALVDTGADECALPASFAQLLEHNLENGNLKEIRTGNGITKAYGHTTVIEMLDFSTGKTIIDYMPHLSTPLLGVHSFLGQFVVTIDYPQKIVRFEL
jgi:predicted aspartyl protease